MVIVSPVPRLSLTLVKSILPDIGLPLISAK
jgi:hypothetical protein